VNIAIDFYVDDPGFYRTLWAAVSDASDDLRGEIYNQKRNDFWRNLVNEAVASGVVTPDIDAELLFHALDRTFGAAMLEWVVGELPSEQLAATIRHSYALILRGAAAPDWRGPLEARLLEAQTAILGAAPAPAV
jgi:hypothetical protein